MPDIKLIEQKTKPNYDPQSIKLILTSLVFVKILKADTRDKAIKMMKKTDSADEAENRKKVAAAAFDTLLWQV